MTSLSSLKLAIEFIEGLGKSVSEVDLRDFASTLTWITGTEEDRLKSLGINLCGNKDCMFGVLEPQKHLGTINILNNSHGGTFVFGQPHERGLIHANFDVSGENATVIICDPRWQLLRIPSVLFRSSNQVLFFGAGASSVGLDIEIEGNDRKVIIGDDCMFSSGIWLRNHDMHTIFDVTTGKILNSAPVDCIIEQHVWVGQDALLLATERVGFGAVIGSRSLCNGTVPPEVIAGGVPARIIRGGASWCRSVHGISPRTKERLARLRQYRRD